MSDIIAVKIKTKEEFGSIENTEILFDIVKNACERKIAVKAFQKGVDCFELSMVELEMDEILLTLSDSYNRELANPLLGNNLDYEVMEYRPQPLIERLNNLQFIFECIFNQKQVEKIEVLLTSEDLVFDNRLMKIDIKDFAKTLEPLIQNTKTFHYQFCWKKNNN